MSPSLGERESIMKTLNHKKTNSNKVILGDEKKETISKEFFKIFEGLHIQNNKENLLEKITKEIEKIDQKIYSESEKERELKTPLTLMDFSQTKKEDPKKQRNAKNHALFSNFFNKTSKDIFQTILIKLILDEDAPKEIKKKIEEYKNCEKTIFNQNEFLMFLINQRVNYMRNQQTNQNEIQMKIQSILNKLDDYQKQEQITNLIKDQKNQKLPHLISEELFQNFIRLIDVALKHNIQLNGAVLKPSF